MLFLGYGGECTEPRQCLLSDGSYATCKNKKCQCGNKKFFDKGICVIENNLRDPCNKNENCLKHGGTCNDVCECGDQKAESEDGTKCIIAATSFGDPCDEKSQCTKKIIDSDCIQNKCSCQEDYHPYGLQCYRNVNLLDPCTHPAECYTNGYGRNDVDCFNGKCTCIGGECRTKSCHPERCTCNTDTDYYNKKDLKCIIQSKFNESCTVSENCIFILGVCDKVCICKAEFVISENKTVCLEGRCVFCYFFLYHWLLQEKIVVNKYKWNNNLEWSPLSHMLGKIIFSFKS